jgi:hypothetical protein
MFHRVGFYSLTLLLVLIFLPMRKVFAQYCVGKTTYVARDETGKIMSVKEMEKIAVKLNGVMLNHKQSAYLKRNNPLIFCCSGNVYAGIEGYCGKVGGMELTLRGKTMRLFFDVPEHNTHYEIDSLPFQKGAFHLRSLKCKDGKLPPLIDNANSGTCFVSADNWEGMDKDWVRHLQPKEIRGAEAPMDSCRDEAISVIDTQTDWAAKWKLYPKTSPWYGPQNQAPHIDFKTSVVLARHYLSNTPFFDATYTIIVDKKGDLAIHPGPRPHPKACNYVFVEFYRSDVKSVEGKPLPPAPER